jgi:hypothetical protein
VAQQDKVQKSLAAAYGFDEEVGLPSPSDPSGGIAAAYGFASTPSPRTAPVEPPGLIEEGFRGVKSGVRQVGAELTSLGAVATDIFGAEETARELAELAQSQSFAIRQDLPRAVEFENAFDSPRNFVFWAARQLGEQVPILASIIGTGGIGAVVGRLIAKRAISKGAANLVLKKFEAQGALAGVVGGATGDISPGASVAAGIAKGSLEAIVPLGLAKFARILPGQADDLIVRIGDALNRITSRPARAGVVGLGASGVEGATEFMQEAVDIATRSFVDDNFDVLSPETRARLIESLATGALVGFFFGGIGGGLSRGPGPDPLTETEEDLTPGLGITPTNPPAVPGGEGPTGPAAPPAGPVGPPSPLPTAEGPPGPPVAPAETPVENLADSLPDATAVIGRREFIQPGTTFERADVAFDTQAIKQKRNTKAFRLDASKAELTPADVTADVFGLPVGLAANNPNITFTQEENQVEALEQAQLATDTMAAFNNAVAAGDRSIARERLLDAKIHLENAIDLGFRYRPNEQGGFRILKDLPEDAFIDTSGETGFDTKFSNLITIVESGANLGKNIGFRFSDTKQAQTQALDVNNRFFSVDVSRLKPSQASSTILTPEEQTSLMENRTPETITLPDGITPLDILDAQAGGLPEINELIRKGMRISLKPGVPFILTETLPLNMFKEEARLPFQRRSRMDYPFSAREPGWHATNWPRAMLRGPGLLGSGKDTKTKKPYNPNTHKPGKVELIRGAHEFAVYKASDVKFFKEVKKTYETLLQRLGLGRHRIILQAGLGGAFTGNGLGSYDMLDGVNQDIPTHIIMIQLPSSRNFATQGDALQTAFHEFGHLITYTKFAEASPAVQESIYNAFVRSTRAGVWLPYNDVASRLFDTVYPTSSQKTFEAGLTKSGFETWYNFDEWMAEQVSRWFQTSQQANSVLDKWVRNLVRALRLAWKHIMKRPIRDFAAAPELQSWLDDMISRKEQGLTPLSAAGAISSIAPDKVQHSQTLDESIGPNTTHSQGASREVKKAIGAALPPRGVKPANGGKPTPPKKLGAELDRYNKVIKWGFSILQLAKQNPHISGLLRYVEFLRNWHNTKMDIISRADLRVKQWTALGKQQADAVGKLLFDIDAMVYLKEGEKARWPTQEEFAALLVKHKINEAGAKHYQRVIQDFADTLDKMQEVLEKDAFNTFTTDENTLQRELNKIKLQMRELKSKPYFPHSRFGDYTIVVRDSKGKTAFMQQFESKKARDRAFTLVHAKFPDSEGFATRKDTMPKEMEVFRGLPPVFLQSLLRKIDPTEEQRRWIDALIFEGTPAQSFKRRFTKRLGIPGFSDDAVRSYANYFFHGANSIARIEWDGDLRRSIADVEREAAELGKVSGVNLDKRRGIIDFMRQHHDFIMTPQNDWASLRSAAFSWYLGFNVSSALINLTQVPLVAYPYLAARFSDFKALRELKRATFDIHNIYNAKEGKIPEDEFWMIDLGIKQGWLDESQALELAAMSEGSNLQRALPGNAGARQIRQIGGWAAFMFQSAEKLNRRVVGRAAYRLAKANPDAAYLRELRSANELLMEELLSTGRSEEQVMAFLAARDAVERTQFEYASAFRPQFMQGKKGVLLTFFMFQQQMLYFARFVPGRGRFLLALLATAGLMGLPGFEDLEAVVNFIGRKLFDKNYNAEAEARRLMIDIGIENPDLLLHGVSRYGFGMGEMAELTGIPLPNVDLSARLSLGRVVPGLQEVTREGDFDRVFTGSITDISGAAFNIPINVLRAMSDGHPDVFKRWERAMPTAIKNTSKMMRFFRDEAAVGRKGEEVVDFDIHDPQDLATIIAQGIGFSPTELSQKWDRERMKAEAATYWKIRRGMLFAQFDWARNNNDREAMADTRAAIRRFNNEAPDPGLRIGGRQLRQSVRGRERARRAAERGLPIARGQRGTARQVNELFPEVIDEEPVR